MCASDAPLDPANNTAKRDLLMQAVAVNEDAYATLGYFVCHEQIDRYKGLVGLETGRHRDTIISKVAIENDREQYSEIRRDNRQLQALSSLDGAWSEGEFGTLLKQTEQLLRTQPTVLVKEERTPDGTTAIYSFEVSAVESPWDFQIGEQHFDIPFRTRIWISESSARILKIERVSTGVPAELGIAEVDWSVALHPVYLDGRSWLLPDTAAYQVIYRDRGRREWNTIKFSDYHRYGAEATIHFN
jgi:hypothetical protein